MSDDAVRRLELGSSLPPPEQRRSASAARSSWRTNSKSSTAESVLQMTVRLRDGALTCCVIAVFVGGNCSGPWLGTMPPAGGQDPLGRVCGESADVQRRLRDLSRLCSPTDVNYIWPVCWHEAALGKESLCSVELRRAPPVKRHTCLVRVVDLQRPDLIAAPDGSLSADPQPALLTPGGVQLPFA